MGKGRAQKAGQILLQPDLIFLCLRDCINQVVAMENERDTTSFPRRVHRQS